MHLSPLPLPPPPPAPALPPLDPPLCSAAQRAVQREERSETLARPAMVILVHAQGLKAAARFAYREEWPEDL